MTNHHESAAEIVNLYDAFGKPLPGMELDWGYSALVRFRGQTILFDAGADADRFGRNANAFGVDLNAIDYGIISHRHGDHYSGFDYLLTINPSLKIYVPEDLAFGCTEGLRFPAFSSEMVNALPLELRAFPGETRTVTGPWGPRFWKADSEGVPTTREVAPGVFLIVTKSELWGDFWRVRRTDPPNLFGMPEVSLALVTSKGVVLLVGCSHTGVENIIIETKRVLQKEIALVTGGFHLLPNNAAEIRQLALMLKNDLGVRQVAPSHCTGMLGVSILRDIYGADFISAGLATPVPFES